MWPCHLWTIQVNICTFKIEIQSKLWPGRKRPHQGPRNSCIVSKRWWWRAVIGKVEVKGCQPPIPVPIHTPRWINESLYHSSGANQLTSVYAPRLQRSGYQSCYLIQVIMIWAVTDAITRWWDCDCMFLRTTSNQVKLRIPYIKENRYATITTSPNNHRSIDTTSGANNVKKA